MKKKNEDDDKTYKRVVENPSRSEEWIALFGSRYKEVLHRITILNFQEGKAKELLAQAEQDLTAFDRVNINAGIDVYNELRSYFVESPRNSYYREVKIRRKKYYTLLDFEQSPESLDLITILNRIVNYTEIIRSAYQRGINVIRWGKLGGVDLIYNSAVKDGIPDAIVTEAHNADIHQIRVGGING